MEMNLEINGPPILKIINENFNRGHGKQAEEYSKVLLKNKIKIEGICGRNSKVYNFAKNHNIKNIYLNISEALKNCEYDFVLVLITWNEIEKEIKK